MELDLSVDSNPEHSIEALQFRAYTTDEVKALSVKEVTNPESFDTLQQPSFGGLYDPAFGPSDRYDGCATCGQGKLHCPGHMGHIELPLPVFNPLLFPAMYRILKSTCFACHRLVVSAEAGWLLQQQCRLVEAGQIVAVCQLADKYGQLVRSKQQKEHVIKKEVLEELTQTFLKGGSEREPSRVKNVESVRSELISRFLKEEMKVSARCPHCKSRVHAVRHENKARLILLARGTKAKDKRSSASEGKVGSTGSRCQEQEADSDFDLEGDDLSATASPGKRKRPATAEPPSKALKSSVGGVTQLTTVMVREHLAAVWAADSDTLRHLYPTLAVTPSSTPMDIFFWHVVPVPPSRYRPMIVLGEKKFENPQSHNLAKVLRCSNFIRELLWEREKAAQDTQADTNTSRSEAGLSVAGKTLAEKLNNALLLLQTSVNVILDKDLDKLSKDAKTGIKQLLEKKAGLLRKNMMGKRVNYAARSVISPDPNINTYEIGIPQVFATALTYPQPVTPWNVHELRQAVMNGPNKHPGAVQVINEDGSQVLLDRKDATQRQAVAKQLLTPTTIHGKQLTGSKKVLRHLKNGDVLLINRQPTLHKPSIQAHCARVLPGEKTLRLHYANCKAYNADFDGDEMNAHFPQNEIGRSEAYNIVSTDHQYLVPKDGTPLAGLIQDHMVSGVQLTIRGRMFNKSDYCRLVYTAIVDKRGPIKLLQPCSLKPHRLWSGKQVLSTVVLNVLPANKPALCLTGRSKVPEKSWIRAGGQGGSSLPHMGESEVVVRQGELLCGVLDKGHYGPTPYGLIHSCYELYGGHVAGNLLTCFGRLFLNFLQWKGFTLGVEDILCKPKADKLRAEIIEGSPLSGPAAAREALNLDGGCDGETLQRALTAAHFNQDDTKMRELDMAMRNKTNTIQNDIVNTCMPKGLHKVFPDNNLQLMVVSGAKGSSVNCMQISCLLGQIELEGRRPPPMLSGRTLPSFRAYDVTPRAGGFVTGRFLTGIRQQEYFFHCMAGREGLVDTAVKTSRSGYLQRCLVKHLEGIKVNYDLTVRDGDSSVIQFYYGEDSLDVCKTGYLTREQFPFLAENHKILGGQAGTQHSSTTSKLQHKIRKWQKKFGKTTREAGKTRRSGFLSFCEDWSRKRAEHGVDSFSESRVLTNGRSQQTAYLLQLWADKKRKEKHRYETASVGCLDPVISRHSPYTQGAIPEKLAAIIHKYARQNLNNGSVGMSEAQFVALLDAKLKRSIVEPGDAVGLLCAQSIGEPSTQMTLNTFHFAGRGEMNVTLGIPRLREILMVGSSSLKTPAMAIPVQPCTAARTTARTLQKQFTKVRLHQVLKDIQVKEWMAIKGKRKLLRRRMFEVTLSFLPEASYSERFNLTPNKILQFVERTYIKKLVRLIRYKIRIYAKTRILSHGTSSRGLSSRGAGSEDDDGDEAPEESLSLPATGNLDQDDDMSDGEIGNDGDMSADKQLRRHADEHDYDDELDEEDDEETAARHNMDDDEVLVDGDLSEHEDLEEMITAQHEATQRHADRANTRTHAVVAAAEEVEDYTYDTHNNLSCRILLAFPLAGSKLDVLRLIQEDVRGIVVHEVDQISRCFLNDEPGPHGPQLHLKTEGINIQELHKHAAVLQVDQLYSNDIHKMAAVYGIEAASRVIVKEIQAVFAAYGIVVDYRHLSLLADYMTFEGVYKPFHRRAMEANPSPLQKMSFETTMAFLIDACIKHSMDDLRSPSSQIVVGKNVTCGTGCLDLATPLMLP